MIRGIGLRGAVAVNVITMIGIGPLITIPLVLAQLHGSVALVAWVVGAVIALCDGLAWAELGSLYPGSGGTYVFLREAFGRERWGRLLAFLFAWQIVFSAPLVLASGYIGFAHYAGYLWPALASDAVLQGIAGAAVGVLTLVLLYRSIDVVGALGIGLAGVAVATLATVIAAAATHFNPARALAADPHVGFLSAVGAGLGPALVITLYDYYGYGQSCTISDEVRTPVRVLPRSVLLSIVLVGLLYVALQVGVLGVVPWAELVATGPGGTVPDVANYVASTVVERVWGSLPARIVTLAILATAFASTFGNLLGYSRIPYAAAVDGLFFRPFAKLHERGRFPYVALAVIGLLALPACFLSLGDVINALTTGLVIIQSIAQLAAVAALRARGVRAPYRMWLYPLPALLALAGWVYIFFSAGPKAIAFGILSLLVGIVAFLWRARRSAQWPFAAKAAAIVLAVAGATFGLAPVPAAAATWGHASTVERDGQPVFEVDGKPFFLYGAAFFYERLPRDQWQPSMAALRNLGINTLDLYVPWNWHELSDGDFDFDGRTSPRRDLDEVLRLAKAYNFKILLRPGPVIRNEWRNGGYPAWLLARPEYGMPLHDLLEGRYPPTATLQNAHSDDAAAQWMQNATHVRYARRWLERVLHECEPYADRILAVALDDDQGAYIDNQTYPAPNFQAYIGWLRDVVHGVTGPNEPVFINTYQMKVTSSSPVWAMGNWYQSDAYAIGEHDRAQLEFSTGLLHTRPRQVMMASEFQAGWLEQPDDVRPRPADPSNTALAMATMIGMGVRGIVNFPAQDTLYPAGWEAPFANSFYAWDAALGLDASESPRAKPTIAFGDLIAIFGPHLAASKPLYDGAVAYLGDGYDGFSTNAFFGDVAARTMAAQRACRDAGLACALVDLAASRPAELAAYPFVIVCEPALDGRPQLRANLTTVLSSYEREGGRVVRAPDIDASQLRGVLRSLGRRPIVEGIPGASFARDATGALEGFLSVPNYSGTDLNVANAAITDRPRHTIALPAFHVAAHSAIVVPVDVRLHAFDARFEPSDRLSFTDCMPDAVGAPLLAGEAAAAASVLDYFYYRSSPCAAFVHIAGQTYTVTDSTRNPIRGANLDAANSPATVTLLAESEKSALAIRNDAKLDVTLHPVPPGTSQAYEDDIYGDGSECAVLDNALVRVIVSEAAGARAFAFVDDRSGRNVFTTVGALRDDVAVEPPLSTTDRIAKYTHQFPAGMFDRPYDTTILSNGPRAAVRFTYDAPDVVPHGAAFSRVVALEPGARSFTVDEAADFHDIGAGDPQRAVSVTSLAVGDTLAMTTQQVFSPAPTAFTALSTLHVATGNALGYYDSATHEFATIAWRAGDVEDATVLERAYSIVVRLTLARGRDAHVRYGYDVAESPEVASALLAGADGAAQKVAVVEKGTLRAPRTP
jgi:basic amino acid/polyamine antiporter, APA family